MGYLNKVLLIGKIGQQPEKRITPQGKPVVNISLATTEYFKDKSGNKQERTEWHKVQLWDHLAEIVEQYCSKGSQIYVEGSLQTREWKDKDGNKRYTTEVVARSIQLLDSKPQSQQSQQHDPYQSPLRNQGYQNSPHDNFQNNQRQYSDDFAEDD